MKYISWCLILMILGLAVAEELSPEVEIIYRLSDSAILFSISLYKKLAERPGGNFIFSPFSITSTLAMLHLGARGKTARELDKALVYDRLNLTRSMATRGYKNFFRYFFNQRDSTYSVLELVNAIFINKHEVDSIYKKRVILVFQSDPIVMNFEGKVWETLMLMNHWVQARTRNKIKTLIDHIDPGVDMIVANAAHLQARWASPFPVRKSSKRLFYNFGKIERKVPVMEQRGYFKFARCIDILILELDFQGDNLSMLFILPRQRDGLKEFEKSPRFEYVMNCVDIANYENVWVIIPKFNVSLDVELSNNLRTLGAVQLFEPEGANFSAMIPCAQVAVGEMKHKAFLAVDELGVETAAVTGTVRTKTAWRKTYDKFFYAEHPFVFCIIDKKADFPLFMGRVWSL